jgi:hypothetical protein
MRAASSTEIALRARESTESADPSAVSAFVPALTGEVIEPTDCSVRIVAALKPFSNEIVERSIGAGHMLLELVALVEPPVHLARLIHVAIGDLYIPRDNWHLVRPKPGTIVTIRVAPGMGGGKKNPLRFILMLVVLAASFALPALFPLTAATAFLGTTVGSVISAVTGLVQRPIYNRLRAPSRR